MGESIQEDSKIFKSNNSVRESIKIDDDMDIDIEEDLSFKRTKSEIMDDDSMMRESIASNSKEFDNK